jgi:hypothetical protein
MGPNIRFLAENYWDFFDHYLPLSDRSLVEVLTKVGFRTERCLSKFMPYTAVGRAQYPAVAIKAYLTLPLAWRIFGKQFLVVAQRPN